MLFSAHQVAMLSFSQLPLVKSTDFVTLPPKMESSRSHAATVATPLRKPVFSPMDFVTEPPILLLVIQEPIELHAEVLVTPIPLVTSPPILLLEIQEDTVVQTEESFVMPPF